MKSNGTDSRQNKSKNPFVFLVTVIASAVVSLLIIGAILLFFPRRTTSPNDGFTYVYSEVNGGYVLCDVSGANDRVEIPKEYNAKPVVGVSCGIFAAEHVAEFVFLGEVFFTDLSLLANADVRNISVLAERTVIDGLRKNMYECTSDETAADNALTLANGMAVFGLEEDEIYLTFNYDKRGYFASGGDVLPVFIGKKGDTFSLEGYTDFDYVNVCDYTLTSHLQTAYDKSGYILRDITVDGQSLFGSYTMTENAAAILSFERVYRVYVKSYDGVSEDIRYVCASTADTFFDIYEIPYEYALSWEYCIHAQSSPALTEIYNLAQTLEKEDADLDIFPVISLKPPEIAITVSAEQNAITYGESVTFYSEVTMPMSGKYLTYEWSHNGETVGREQSLYLAKPSIVGGDCGAYTLTVRVFSDVTTIHGSQAEAQIELFINKKQVLFDWVLPLGVRYVYDGTAKRAETALNDKCIESGDEVFLVVDGAEAVDAGEYVATADLGGADSGNYCLIMGTTFNYTIKKADLVLSIDISDTTYGETPSPRLDGNVGGGKEEYSYHLSPDLPEISSPLTVGSYYVAVRICETRNYNSAVAFMQFEITPLEVELEWENCDDLVYDGEAKDVYASIIGALSGDIVAVKVTGGDEVNAGSYTAVAELYGKDAFNYRLPPSYEYKYEIKKAAVVIDGAEGGVFIIDGFVELGTTLASLTDKLPLASTAGKWVWSDGDDCLISNMGENSFYAVFNPADGRNYLEAELRVKVYAKRVNDFEISLGSAAQISQFIDPSQPFYLKWNGEPIVIDYLIFGAWGNSSQGKLTIEIARADGKEVRAETDTENMQITLAEKGEYVVTFVCAGNDEYFESRLSVTVIVE